MSEFTFPNHADQWPRPGMTREEALAELQGPPPGVGGSLLDAIEERHGAFEERFGALTLDELQGGNLGSRNSSDESQHHSQPPLPPFGPDHPPPYVNLLPHVVECSKNAINGRLVRGEFEIDLEQAETYLLNPMTKNYECLLNVRREWTDQRLERVTKFADTLHQNVRDIAMVMLPRAFEGSLRAEALAQCLLALETLFRWVERLQEVLYGERLEDQWWDS